MKNYATLNYNPKTKILSLVINIVNAIMSSGHVSHIRP